MRKTILVLAFTAALLAAPAAAGAGYDPVVSGQTKLRLDKSFLALLKDNGVKLRAAEGVQLKANTVAFPVVGGKFDPTTGKGFVEHAGGLFFERGRRRVALTSLQLKTTQRHAPFSAKFGGGQLKMATTAKLAVSRKGFGDKVTVSILKLSAKVATRLSKKLRLHGVFKAGQPLGTTVTTTVPQTVTLQGTGKASLTFDPTFQDKLTGLFVALNPIFPAEHPGLFTLPIFGGTLAPTGSTGRISLSGGLEFLQLGGGQVFWREASLDFAAHSLAAEVEVDPSPPYSGKLGLVEIAAFSGGSVTPEPKARAIAASSLALALSPQMAATFEEVFAKPQGRSGVFNAGEAVGTVSFGAQGQ
jgi:hypothetical protein